MMMKLHQAQINFSTRGHGDMHDLTRQVEEIVREAHIGIGSAHVFNVGSTGAIGAIEYEPGLCEDLPEMLNRLAPADGEYAHQQTWKDGNGHSHLQATTLGPGLTVPVRRGRLALGTWQQIFHIECDVRPRDREVLVTVMGTEPATAATPAT